MTTSVRAPVAEGDVLAGKYVVERVLGAGGMGVVVAARHVQLGSTIALKFMLEAFAHEPHTVARFMREAQSATRITSEHVARVLDVGQLASGAPYMVMEYLEGSDLSNLVETRGPLPIPEAIEYVTQACRALAEAHGKGIVHRDIKPSNLFLTQRYDGTPLVKVLDFGIAKTTLSDAQTPGDLTQTQSMMGSPLYASPEQLDSARHANERADIWALGVTLHFLVSAQHPFYADSHAKLVASIMMGKPTPLRAHRPDAPEALERLILRCLERDPSLRFGSVREFVAALSSLSPGARASTPYGEGTAVLSNPHPVLAASGEEPGRTTLPHSVTGTGTAAPRSAARFAWLAVAAVAVGAGVFVIRGKASDPATTTPAAPAEPAAAVRPPAPPLPPHTAPGATAAPSDPAIAVEPAVTPAPTSAPATTPAPSSVAAKPPVSKPAGAKPPAPIAKKTDPRTKPAASPGTETKAAPPLPSPARVGGVDSLLDERR